MIVFDDVTKRFGKRTVLEDINFEIKPGEFISVIGDSGSGKTTLIKMILADEQPSQGKISVNGRDLRDVRGHELQHYRRNIGVVFQDYKLIPNKTVFENVAYALEMCDYPLTKIFELVPQALSMLGLTHLQDQYPNELSGGEAQRVSLARAIVHKPNIVLADEPTGNLDHENAMQVLKNLIKINLGGVTVLLTTHNKPLVDLIGQKKVHLSHGKIAV